MLRRRSLPVLPALCALLTACGGPTPPPGAPGAPSGSDAVEAPARPSPFPGAPALTLGEFAIGAVPGTVSGGVDAETIAELVTLALLERRDVHFVERRRFQPAAAREAAGDPPEEGRPPLGRTVAVEWTLSAAWTPISGRVGRIDARIADAAGVVVTTWRHPTDGTPDPVAIARAVAATLLPALDTLAAPVPWDDAAPVPLDPEGTPTGVPTTAVMALMEGVRAGDRWDFDAATAAYRRALELAGEDFPEAQVALRRAQRLRAGGALAGS